VYSQSTGGDPVFVPDADGGNSKEVLGSEEGNHQHFPTWSPKGLWIYLVRGHVRTDEMDLWRLRPDGTGLEQLTEGLRNVMFPAPIDERTVLFVANDADGSGPWLWELDVGTRVWRRATIGPARYTSVSASRDGRRLVATVANPQVGLYTIPIPSEGQATEDAVKAHPLKAVRALAPRLRGDQLFYLSSRGGGDGLWRYRNGEAREIWKGSDAPLLVPAAISPDGTRVAVVAREGRRSRLYVMRSDGTDRQPLMDQVDIVGAACWSPDGKWIAAGGRKGSERGLFKVDVHDGRTTPLGSVEAMNPVWSPQGDMIVFEGPQVSYPVPLLAVTPDGARIEWFPQIAVRPFGERARFLPDGSGLVYLKGVNPYQEFHLLDLASAKRGEEHVSRQLTDLADWDLRTFDITPDGKTIVFDRKRDNSDIVLIERGAGR
jgi:Tol biopolymer transport system component